MHNAKIAREQERQPPSGCNCIVEGGSQRFSRWCLTHRGGLIYQVKVARVDTNHFEFYTGCTEQKFNKNILLFYFYHSLPLWANTPGSLRTRVSTRCSGVVHHRQGKGGSTPPPDLEVMSNLLKKYCIMFRPEGAALNSRAERKFVTYADTVLSMILS